MHPQTATIQRIRRRVASRGRGGACGMAVREEPPLTAGHATPSARVAHCTFLVQAAGVGCVPSPPTRSAAAGGRVRDQPACPSVPYAPLPKHAPVIIPTSVLSPRNAGHQYICRREVSDRRRREKKKGGALERCVLLFRSLVKMHSCSRLAPVCFTEIVVPQPRTPIRTLEQKWYAGQPLVTSDRSGGFMHCTSYFTPSKSQKERREVKRGQLESRSPARQADCPKAGPPSHQQ